MSPSDKNEASDSKQEGQIQGNLKANGMDHSLAGVASSSASEYNTPGQGTITNIPLFTAKISTNKCSENDQMKTFDPGEVSNNERTFNKQCGYPLTFPLKSSINVTKNKNYKAGSKINKLADMLAKRSQNIVEMTQNATSDIIAGIISAPKIECSNAVEVSDIAKVEGKFEYLDVICEKTVESEAVDCVSESLKKSVPNDNSESNNQFQSQSDNKHCSDISELVSNNETGVSDLNALEEHLIKPETDESTKTKKEPRKNLKNVELSLILPEKKRRSSPRKKLVNNDKTKPCSYSKYQEEKSRIAEVEESPGAISVEQTNSVVVNVKSVNTACRTKTGRQRKSKRLVETSTQTSTIDFTGNAEATKPEPEAEAPKDKEKCVYACLYCASSFVTKTDCKDHEKTHSHKRSKQTTKCQFCLKEFPSFQDLKSHCIKSHPNKYAYCVKCDERFCEKAQLYSHNKLVHLNKVKEDTQGTSKTPEATPNPTREKKKEETEDAKKSLEKKATKVATTKPDLKVDVTFESSKKSSTSPRTVPKVSPRENKTEEQLLEMEMLFYSNLSGNIKENLTNHLDGKIDKNGNPIQTEANHDSLENSQAKAKTSNLLSLATSNHSGAPVDQVSRAPSPYQTRSKTPNPLPPTAKKFKKLPNWQQKFWEKYNFPTNYRYEHRFWDKNYLNTEKSAFYLKDLSCLDIKTQLIMRENIKKLDDIKAKEESTKSPADKLSFPEYLALVPRVSEPTPQITDSEAALLGIFQNKLPPGKDDKETKSPLPPPPPPVPESDTTTPPPPPRRKTSADNSASKRHAERNASKATDGTKMMTRRQSVIELGKDAKKSEESAKRRKGSLDVTGSQKMTLRRQTSLDNLQRIYGPESSNSAAAGNSTTNKATREEAQEPNTGEDEALNSQIASGSGIAEISGEWVRPRSYLCGTCCTKFTNLWELEDHKWVNHPNVWCTHYEFEDEKIEKLFNRSDTEAGDENEESAENLSKLKLTDLYKRYLLPHGSLKTAKLVPNTSFPEQCTKCKKNCMNSSEMHKHMLDCGGDTTWFLTMYSSPMTIKRKWRPFGSRRRKQIGRRVLKRNIPNPSNMRPYHYQHRIRTKPGDVESIQKMLANLPEKRARRAINFDEIKTRSQATIHSNRLLRKRFKVSFGTNIMRLKALKQQRQVKTKKEGNSKSPTDTSSETTPAGSPKRRNKLKESLQGTEAVREAAGDDAKAPKTKKKVAKPKKGKKESGTKQETSKANTKKGGAKGKGGKPVTRSGGSAENAKDGSSKRKKGSQAEKSEPSEAVTRKNAKDVKPKRQRKKVAKKDLPRADAVDETVVKVEEDGFAKKKLKTEIKQEGGEEAEEGEGDEEGDEEEEGVGEKSAGVSEGKTKKKGKNALRLKTNEKEKTEPIKKTVRNSKKSAESKEEYEKRRSQRIKTLTSPETSILEKALKDQLDGRTPQAFYENALSKKQSKTTKAVKATDGDSPPTNTPQDKPETLPREETLPTAEKDQDGPLKVESETKSVAPVGTADGLDVEKTVQGDGSQEVTKSSDLSEMPVLDKEEPTARGRATRKSETEIPVLMPFENEEKEKKASKRKGKAVGQTGKKPRKSLEEGDRGTSPGRKGPRNDSGKSRKRSLAQDTTRREKSPKTPKIKKYFLGICPNEIDKGGEDDSSSDGEPLITLVMNQKLKSAPPPEVKEEPKTEEKVDEAPDGATSQEVEGQQSLETKESGESPSEPPLPVDETNKKDEVESAKSEKVEPEVTQTPEKEATKEESKKPGKGLKMTVKLKEATPKIVDISAGLSNEEGSKLSGGSEVKGSEPAQEGNEVKIGRRSRRVSKEIKSSTNEFVIDDPLILVDELWSDLDSDSDSSRKKSRKGKKRAYRKKNHEDRKESSVDLEELLRNFGESKNTSKTSVETTKRAEPKTKPVERKRRRRKKKKKVPTVEELRKRLKKKVGFSERSYGRLSLRLFRFHKKVHNFGNSGRRLSDVKSAPVDDAKRNLKLPPLPFLAAEIKENPVQIIQCGVQKPKTAKKAVKKCEARSTTAMQLKISLPLQSISNLAVLNNNHLTEVASVDVPEEEPRQENIPAPPPEEVPLKPEDVTTDASQKDEEMLDNGDSRLKSRRSEVIDKIFYCEICKTYYYSSSQLKIHKLSNRHKLNEAELMRCEEAAGETVPCPIEPSKEPEEVPPEPEVEVALPEPEVILPQPEVTSRPSSTDPEKLNEDTSEMPILEGPFIENPFVRLGMDLTEPSPPLPPPPPPPQPQPPPPPPPSNVFGFTEDCLKDIQRAIGCTDEEMLLLTLLGDNSIEIENDILDLDTCKPVTPNATATKMDGTEEAKKDNSNGLLKMDFKKRITSALARLVNKAVLNLLQKYKSTNRTGISSEALSFLVKLSKMNNKKNLLELDELLKESGEGEPSNRAFAGEEEKKDAYKYQCTICGSRFQKESMRECHIIRSHRMKGSKAAEDVPSVEEDLDEPGKYPCGVCGSRFQTESTRECHAVRCHRPGAPSSAPREDDRKEQSNAPYKYLCTICGSRFQKESMWECHVRRSHKAKGKKNGEDVQTTYDEEWNGTWSYDMNDELPGSVDTPQFLCSDCGINFISPQEVLEHQKLEHAVQKDTETNENGPLQSSTIGSSDEIIKGKKGPRRGPKHLTKAELDQQRIIANNELRKLDRKFSCRNKGSKIKWGMDALKFTVEKENKAVGDTDEKEVVAEEKAQPEMKNIDIIPKLNLSRTNNIPEFKVVQKTSCLNRFQRILDNKMKRKGSRGSEGGKDADEKEGEDVKAFAEPVAVLKKERKRKPSKYNSKKDEARKVFDVYDFNDSESETEPVAFSHVKKTCPVLQQSPTKLKLVKVREAMTETSKNKADSTTKDLETEDYDSEDSLPLAVVKRTKTEDDEEEGRAEEQAEKSEGILEQVEYLIEQLENETNHPESKQEMEKVKEDVKPTAEESQRKRRNKRKLNSDSSPEEDSGESEPESFRVSLENKFLQLESIALKKKPSVTGLDFQETVERTEMEKPEEVLPVADSSQDISDEEDSLPLVLMSKKNELCDLESSPKKDHEPTPESLSLSLPGDSSQGEKETADPNLLSPKNALREVLPREFDEPSEKSENSFETLNGNVIYRRNDSMSDFESDLSDYGPFDTDKGSTPRQESESLIKEVMEREDVVIVCSKKENDATKGSRRKSRESMKRKKQRVESSAPRKKKILPLLSVTLEENNFRKSESPKLKKDVIVKKIWSRKRFAEEEEVSDREVNEFSGESIANEDSHSEIDKEIIMKKIWNKRRFEHDTDAGEVQVTKVGDKTEDKVKINQTEVSDEVVIKCGPKARGVAKRRKSRSSTKESSKERIMRKIWSGKCTFQTKAALKTYDSDIIPKEGDALGGESRVRKRGRPPNFLNTKKTKLQSEDEKSDEDDLDSLLEEIEREEVEKAIRLEFLQLRRSDKANPEMVKESGNVTVGLFTETFQRQGKDAGERRRRRIRKNLKHPRKGLLKRRKFMKKPTVKGQQQQQSLTTEPSPQEHPLQDVAEEESKMSDDDHKPDEESSDVSLGQHRKSFDFETKIKNRKHKKHRHKHHHHKHKHKKSKHHKYVVGKHKVKHKSSGEGGKEKTEEMENFSILEKMCQDIPSQIEKQQEEEEQEQEQILQEQQQEQQLQQSQKRFDSAELDSLDTKLDEILMSTTSSSFEGKAKEYDEEEDEEEEAAAAATAAAVAEDEDDDDVFYGNAAGGRAEKERSYGNGNGNGNVYDFVEEDSSFLCESKGSHK